MSFIIPDEDDWKRTTSRANLMGPPNSWKTSSLATLPHDKDNQLVIISYPGEMGANSLPRGPGIKTFVWQNESGKVADSKKAVNDVYQLTVDIIAGKHGKVRSFAGDGLHKLAAYYLDAASNGEHFAGEDFTIEKTYGKQGPHTKLYARFMKYLELLYFSPIPFVVFTCWDGKEPGEYKGMKVDGGRVYPGLPGQLAKMVLGMFSLNIYSQVTAGLKGPVGRWQLKEDKDVAGAACKLPLHILKKLDDKVEQDFQRTPHRQEGPCH